MMHQASAPDWESRVRASFARQSFVASLGAGIERAVPGEIHIALPHSPAHSQQHGFLHGGVVASILDSACGYAALSLLPSDREVLTIEFKINFLSPARGERFLAVGRVVKPGRTVTVCAGEVIATENERKTTIAMMQATMFSVATSS